MMKKSNLNKYKEIIKFIYKNGSYYPNIDYYIDELALDSYKDILSDFRTWAKQKEYILPNIPRFALTQEGIDYVRWLLKPWYQKIWTILLIIGSILGRLVLLKEIIFSK